MSVKKFLKKYAFTFLLFLDTQIFMDMLGNKAYLRKSLFKYPADLIISQIFYYLFVLAVLFVFFHMYFTKQATLCSYKKKLMCFAGLIAVYEISKAITYLIVKDSIQSIYFILNDLFLIAAQITFLRMFNGIDLPHKTEKLSIGKKQIIAAVLLICTAIGVFLYEKGIYPNGSDRSFVRSEFVVFGYALAFVTALVQTVFFGCIMNEELTDEPLLKKQYILWKVAGGISTLLWAFALMIK